jgi:serine/threonine-protein kinase RsbW
MVSHAVAPRSLRCGVTDVRLPMSAQLFSQIVLKAQVQELERLSRWLAELSEAHHLSPQVAAHLDLCLTEIVTNCIIHGYSRVAAPTDAVFVSFARQSAQVVCCIEDRGVAFDPPAHAFAPLPTSLENAQVGGSGLRLVRRFADQLDYRREGGINHLTIVFSTSEG